MDIKQLCDGALHNFTNVSGLDSAWNFLSSGSGGVRVEHDGKLLRMFRDGDQLSFDNIVYGTVAFPVTFAEFKTEV